MRKYMLIILASKYYYFSHESGCHDNYVDILKKKKYPRRNNIFNRALRFFLSVPRSTPLAGREGDMGWLSPKYTRILCKVRLWNRLAQIDSSR